MGIEAQKGQEQIEPTAKLVNKAKEIDKETLNKVGNTIDQKYTDLKEDRNSKKMLNDMDKKGIKIDNITVSNTLKNPDKQNVKNMQDVLGYKNQEGKNFYNPIHLKDMKSSDGQAGPFTLAAINNMSIDPNGDELSEMNTIKEGISDIKGVKEFIGTLHPHFFNKFKDTETTKFDKNSKEYIVFQTMKGIINGEVKSKEEIQTMQVALHDLGLYPATHNKEQKDGVPGPFTQVALQNFALKKL